MAESQDSLQEGMEKQAAKAAERLVAGGGFSELLAQLAENTAAMTRMGAGAMDSVLRNLRVAGRRDITRLSGQLARTEDKLERVLQEVEHLRDELAERPAPRANGRAASSSSSARRKTKRT
jgi:hypothetical protein